MSGAKSVPWRKRADLHFVPLESDGQPVWGIKDSLNLNYFELSDEAYFVLNELDGQNSVEDIRRAFELRYRPRVISSEELNGFVAQLIAQNLLIADGFGYGRALVAKRKVSMKRRSKSFFSNLLAIRFRGVDPDRFFEKLTNWVGWIFTPVAMSMGLFLILSAIALVVVQFDELLARLPDTQALLSFQNLIWLSVSLAVVKILHEFGHGLACKCFGGECHELGVMLLVFTPTLYCNVSDIWMLKDKWKRIAVSLAGMWVELNIAAICTFLWWFSVPGLFHSLCLNLIFLCSVNTVFFNGNPLLRYDGYFVLSDFLGISNMQQRSMALVTGAVSNWFCGFRTDDGIDSGSRWKWGLIAYGLASSFYRVMLSVLILWGLYYWLAPHGLGVFVQLFAVLTLGSMVLIPMVRAVTFLRSPPNASRIHWPQFILRGTGAIVLLIGLLVVPLPCRVSASAIAEDDDADRVYVTFAGTLTESARIGQHVERDQVIARLEDPRLKISLSQLRGELDQQRGRLDQLERRRVAEPQLAQRIPTIRESVIDLENQLAQRTKDAERLVVRSPRSGVVLSANSPRTFVKSGSLGKWTGSPLDERNLGCYLPAGTTLCSIGNSGSGTALLLVNQDDVKLVRSGQRVKLLWNELSGQIQEGEVTALSDFDLDAVARQTVVKLNLPSRITSAGTLRLVGKWYQARVKLEETDPPLTHGATGVAKIVVDPQSAGQRLIRWLRKTFPF